MCLKAGRFLPRAVSPRMENQSAPTPRSAAWVSKRRAKRLFYELPYALHSGASRETLRGVERIHWRTTRSGRSEKAGTRGRVRAQSDGWGGRQRTAATELGQALQGIATTQRGMQLPNRNVGDKNKREMLKQLSQLETLLLGIGYRAELGLFTHCFVQLLD